MSVIKQISIFNGSSWEQAADIGANAENIDFTYTTGSQQGNTVALSSILPAQVLTASKVLTTDSNGKLSSSSISSNVFNAMLSGATTANASFQSQIDTLNAKFHVKSYNVTPTANSSVSPFSAYSELSIAEDVATFGSIVGIRVTGGLSANPVIVKTNNNADTLWVYAKSANTPVAVKILFMK